jgi:hypothetical protein
VIFFLMSGSNVKSDVQVLRNIVTHWKKQIEMTVKPVLCDLPRDYWNKVTKDRWSLNTGLIDVKNTVNWN